MPVPSDIREEVAEAAMRAPSVTCYELSESLSLSPDDVMEALREERASITSNVLDKIGIGDLTCGSDVDLAIAVIANKWPEESTAGLAEIFEACLGYRVTLDALEETLARRKDLLRGDRKAIESVPCQTDDARRAIYYANLWPELMMEDLSWELAIKRSAIRATLASNEDLLVGKRAEWRRNEVGRAAWRSQRCEAVLAYALEKPELSLKEIAEDLSVPYTVVRDTIARHSELFAGMPPRPRSRRTSEAEYLELDDVLAYVEALDEGMAPELARSGRRA